jgi:hypothetical protein
MQRFSVKCQTNCLEETPVFRLSDLFLGEFTKLYCKKYKKFEKEIQPKHF